ncbi:phage holin family protein [Budvicia diplopodorum]|uniref:phage holin family protein n=1 Tax=Budvicia diplopodorum TaxID=1119056 RepID=UPI001357EB63|nr:phage holin family protein [Budvicia diplopodorum]
MLDNSHPQGPAKGALSTIQRILALLLGMVETRIELLCVELEEQKAHLTQLLIVIGLTLLFAGFFLMGLFILICFAIDPAYRLMALSILTGILFVLSLASGLWAISKARQSTFLKETRNQLKLDSSLLRNRK